MTDLDIIALGGLIGVALVAFTMFVAWLMEGPFSPRIEKEKETDVDHDEGTARQLGAAGR